MQSDLEKLSFLYKYLDAIYYFKNEDVNEDTKRVVSRYFFILIDDILKLVGKIKNSLYRNDEISRNQKLEFENKIKQLQEIYDGNYDIIRDKFSAHQQPVEFMNLLEWWFEIDNSTIEIFYDAAHAIRSELKLSYRDFFTPIRDYSKLQIEIPRLSKSLQNKFHFSSDRLAPGRENTGHMIPCHETQEKAQTI